MNMNIKLEDMPKRTGKPHPILKDLPDALKNYDKYPKIEKSLALIVLTSHKHKTVSSYVKCEECKGKMQEKQDAIKALGFTSFEQYMEWKKVMQVIIKGKVLL